MNIRAARATEDLNRGGRAVPGWFPKVRTNSNPPLRTPRGGNQRIDHPASGLEPRHRPRYPTGNRGRGPPRFFQKRSKAGLFPGTRDVGFFKILEDNPRVTRAIGKPVWKTSGTPGRVKPRGRSNNRTQGADPPIPPAIGRMCCLPEP